MTINLGKLLYKNRQQGHATTNPFVRALVMRRCKFRCKMCGRKYTKNAKKELQYPNKYFTKAQIDHIIPFALGGRNHIKNYQLLCRACNLKKSDNVEEP